MEFPLGSQIKPVSSSGAVCRGAILIAKMTNNEKREIIEFKMRKRNFTAWAIRYHLYPFEPLLPAARNEYAALHVHIVLLHLLLRLLLLLGTFVEYSNIKARQALVHRLLRPLSPNLRS